MGFRLFWAGNMVRCESSSNHAPEYSHGSSRGGLSFYVKNLARALPKGIVQERSKQSSENWSDDIDP